MSVAEIASDLVKDTVGRTAEKLFRVFGRKELLLEEELKAPGREISYLIRCAESFGKPHR